MDTSTSLWTWPNAIAGTLVASLGAIFGYLIRRKKLPSEIHKTEADAGFIDAQRDDLRLKTDLSAIEMFREMAADIGDLEFEKIQLKKEVLRLTERTRILEVEVERSKAERMLQKLPESES